MVPGLGGLKRGARPKGVPLFRINYYVVNFGWAIIPVLGALAYAGMAGPSEHDLQHELREKYKGALRQRTSEKNARAYTDVLRVAGGGSNGTAAAASEGATRAAGMDVEKRIDGMMQHGRGAFRRATATEEELTEAESKRAEAAAAAAEERAAAAEEEAAAKPERARKKKRKKKRAKQSRTQTKKELEEGPSDSDSDGS